MMKIFAQLYLGSKAQKPNLIEAETIVLAAG